MVSFLLIIRRVLKGIRGAWHQAPFRAAFLILLALLVSGTVFYSTVEEWSIVDSLYFSVITLATVGYGDFARSPRPTAQRSTRQRDTITIVDESGLKEPS